MTSTSLPDAQEWKRTGTIMTAVLAGIITIGVYTKMKTADQPTWETTWHTTHPLPETVTRILTVIPEQAYTAAPITIAIEHRAIALPYDMIETGAFVQERVTVPCYSNNPARRHTTEMTINGVDIGPSLEDHITSAMAAGYSSLEFIAKDGQRLNVPIAAKDDTTKSTRFLLLPYEENDAKQVDTPNDIIIAYQDRDAGEQQGQQDNILYLSALDSIKAANNPMFGFVNQDGERFSYESIDDVLRRHGIKGRTMRKEGVPLSELAEGDVALKGADDYQAVIQEDHLHHVTITKDKRSYKATAPELGRRSEVYDIVLIGLAKGER